MPIPKYDDLFNPTLKALHKLGGSASNQEPEDEVSQILKLKEDEFSIIMPKQNHSNFCYRLAWARSYLKRAGLIDNKAYSVRNISIIRIFGERL